MRIALGIEYDGTAYMGWQHLRHGPNIQDRVEAALSFVADAPVAVQCAGRTDSGVHACCQVVHFDTGVEREPRAWVLGGTANLPPDIAVLWARRMGGDFDARFAARARRYRYVILNRTARPALDARYVTWEHQPLNAARMHEAAQVLLGEHDFSSFRAVSCQARHPVRNLRAITVERQAERVIIEVEANAFLHHMVRNIVGTLLLVGRGERPPGWVAEVFDARDRKLAGPTAPSTGLVFVGPRYPARFGLPAALTL